MTWIVKKALKFVNRDDKDPSEKNWEKFRKTCKTGPSMECLIVEFFHFSAKIVKGFVLSG